jgi:hypothetical protein
MYSSLLVLPMQSRMSFWARASFYSSGSFSIILSLRSTRIMNIVAFMKAIFANGRSSPSLLLQNAIGNWDSRQCRTHPATSLTGRNVDSTSQCGFKFCRSRSCHENILRVQNRQSLEETHIEPKSWIRIKRQQDIHVWRELFVLLVFSAWQKQVVLIWFHVTQVRHCCFKNTDSLSVRLSPLPYGRSLGTTVPCCLGMSLTPPILFYSFLRLFYQLFVILKVTVDAF